MATDKSLEAGIRRIIERMPRRLIEDLRDYATHGTLTAGWTPELAAQARTLAEALAASLERAEGGST